MPCGGTGLESKAASRITCARSAGAAYVLHLQHPHMHLGMSGGEVTRQTEQAMNELVRLVNDAPQVGGYKAGDQA
jgi:hypothetical protein